MTVMASTNTRPNTAAMSRRLALQMPLAGLAAAWLGSPSSAWAVGNDSLITVWKNPDCGCCKEWVTHLKKNGFEVVTNDIKDTAPIRQKLGLPAKFG